MPKGGSGVITAKLKGWLGTERSREGQRRGGKR